MEIFERLNCVIIDGKSYVKASDAKLMYDEIERLRAALREVLHIADGYGSSSGRLAGIVLTASAALEGGKTDV
jgi:hypothetical protein